MDKNTKPKIRIISAVIMLVLAGLFLFTVEINSLLFGVLPKTEGWIMAGIYLPYILIVVSVIFAIQYFKKVK